MLLEKDYVIFKKTAIKIYEATCGTLNKQNCGYIPTL